MDWSSSSSRTGSVEVTVHEVVFGPLDDDKAFRSGVTLYFIKMFARFSVPSKPSVPRRLVLLSAILRLYGFTILMVQPIYNHG